MEPHVSFGRMRIGSKSRPVCTPLAGFTMFVKSTASPDGGPAGQKQNILEGWAQFRIVS